MLITLLFGLALAQDDIGESWGIEIEMLEPDIDFLMESLEDGSCYCACEDWCAGTCEGGDPCETWCDCAVPEVILEPDPESPPPEPPPTEALPPPPMIQLPVEEQELAMEVPPPPEPEPSFEPALESVFQGEVSVPTCRCVWRMAAQGCNASVDWPAGSDDCDCSRFDTPPGCDGDALVISVLLGTPAPKRRRW